MRINCRDARDMARIGGACLLLALFALLVSMPPVPARAQGERLVLAFYYAWYGQDFWQQALSDQPTQTYVSTDPAAIERHVAWAQQAGIDAFVQSWYGPQVENNQTEPNFAALLDISARRGFRAAVDFELVSPFFHSEADVVAALQYLLAVHANHPAYLRVGGKPVIFFWRQQVYPLETWLSIRNQVDPQRASIWIEEGVTLDLMEAFDGHHLYSVAWDARPDNVLVRWGQRVRDWSARHGADRYWVATVMPGYNDLVTGRPDAFVRDRAGGDYYRLCWDGAIRSGADMVIITSFNEWLEGTQIEPSVSYGDAYLNLTRELGDQYRASPALPPAPLPAVTPTSLPSPSPMPRPTDTPTPTMTPTPTPEPTPIPTPRPTRTPLPTPTATPLPTLTPAATFPPTPPLTPPAWPEAALSWARAYPGLIAAGLALVLIVAAAVRGRRRG